MDKAPLNKIEIIPDEHSHIEIKKMQVCSKSCSDRPCTFICPSLVFRWDEEDRSTTIQYELCVECGACAPACPFDNISLGYPRGGFGKILHD